MTGRARNICNPSRTDPAMAAKVPLGTDSSKAIGLLMVRLTT